MSQSRSRFDVSSVNGVQQCNCWRHHFCRSFVLNQSRSKVLPAWVSREKKKRKEEQARKESKQNKDASIQAKRTIKRLTVWEALVQILALVLKTTDHEAFWDFLPFRLLRHVWLTGMSQSDLLHP